MTQRRLAPALRRAHIAEAAREAILRDGLRHTGLREIAREAQTSVGTVTYHFGSIREIILEAAVLEADRFYAPVVAAVDAEADVVRALLLLIDPLFDGSADSLRHWRFWSDYWGEWARDPETRQDDYGRLRQWSSCCERTIGRGIAEGRFAPHVDPLASAVKTAAFMDGIYTQLSLGAPALDHAVARDWMRDFLQAELGAPFADT